MQRFTVYRIKTVMGAENSKISDEAKVREQFVEFTRCLCARFPQEDLRFNRKQGSRTVRVIVPPHSQLACELELSETNPEDTIVQAIFAVKELTRAFDA